MAAALQVLATFNGTDGDGPQGGLITDINGDLLGVTAGGGPNLLDGTAFEIARTATGYASTPTTLTSFDGSDGANPSGGLTADVSGDLFGTTAGTATHSNGTLFEIVKTATGYVSTATTLVSFDGTDGANPYGGLITDANGDLFGTTHGDSDSDAGTVFEIVKTATGYASIPTTLVSFEANEGSPAYPFGSLISDANGDLFGTSSGGGGANSPGTVFEIAKTATGYASIANVLVSFNGTEGADLLGALIADANGDLFGTTSAGGSSGNGTVFEIAKTATGYASTPTTLVNFSGADGSSPGGSLIADANGDLFGTTTVGGADSSGTVFEIAKTSAGYASTPTTLVSFNGIDGSRPNGSLIADADGDLFGTTSGGGPHLAGTVFEITSSGFQVASVSSPTPTPTPTPIPTPGLAVLDTTTGQALSATAQPYTGPVSGLSNEYINITTDSLNISVSTPNWFIHSGSGDDALAVSSGINVLDGGTGSNFLTGGSGTDTFFVDDRGPTADIWSTVNNFHSGDAATIWGVTASDFALSWVDGQGASGYTGLTLHATAADVPTASLTLAGFTTADLTDGRLTVSFGTTAATAGVPGSAYMYVQAN